MSRRREHRRPAARLALLLACCASGFAVPFDSGGVLEALDAEKPEPQATFHGKGKQKMRWDWKQWKLVPASALSAPVRVPTPPSPRTTPAPSASPTHLSEPTAAPITNSALSKMGSMGKRVLNELGRLQTRLQHTTAMLRKRVQHKAVPVRPPAKTPAAAANEKPSAPPPVVLHVYTAEHDRYSKSVLNQLGQMENELKKVASVRQRVERASKGRPRSVDQVIDHYEKMEHHQVPVNDFSEGHNWSHEGETDFIFGKENKQAQPKHFMGAHGVHQAHSQPKPDQEERKLKTDNSAQRAI